MKHKAVQFKLTLTAVLILFILLPSMTTANDGATITGKILDSQSGEPLPRVTVMLEGTKIGTYSDLDGHFTLKNIEPGNYNLIISIIGYKKEKMPVKVNPGNTNILGNILLISEAFEIEGIKVTAQRVTDTEAALLRIQQRAPSISDGISAEQIARSADSDAAGALKRVTGVTVVGGKYVYVRGMGERYSNTLLNGAPLPSPEPKKRVIPMDLIPANLLENVVTTKTFTPDQWGDFSGGSVRLNTKEFPEKFTFNFSASRGWDTRTAGKTFYSAPGGDTDWLGMDDGSRQIPEIVLQALESGWTGSGGWNGYTQAQLAQMFRQVWDGRPQKAPLNQSYGLSIGSQFNLLNRPLGYIFSLTYSNKYDNQKETQKTYNSGYGGLSERSTWDIEKSTYSVLWGGIFNLNYKIHPLHKLLLQTTYTRDATDEVRFMKGWYEDWDWIESRLNWVEQSLAHYRLSGEHELPAIFSSRLDWSAAYGEAKRKEPDRSTLLWSNASPDDTTLYYLNTQKMGCYRIFDDTKDENKSFFLDWTKNFRQWKGLLSKFKLGWSLEKTDREDRLGYLQLALNPPPGYWVEEEYLLENRPSDDILSPARGVTVKASVSYWADKTISAGYLMFDLPVFKPFHLITGIRVEDTEIEFTYNVMGTNGLAPRPEDLRSARKKHTDWLPSLNLTYNLTERMNLRFAVSKTISRPEYYELVPREDVEIFENLKSFGNPELEHTIIRNYDTRWEFYPRPGEVLAISIFYKSFRRPIEQVYTMMGAHTLTPINIDEAYNSGVEFEARKQLDFLWGKLSNFSLNANYSKIKSRVKIGELGNRYSITNQKRALVGQSPYVINLALGYQNQLGTSIRLLYNKFGQRIAYPGTYGNPDILEEPFTQLDLVFEQKFFKRLGVKMNASNLLDSEVKFNQGEEEWRRYKKGVSYSVGLSYDI